MNPNDCNTLMPPTAAIAPTAVVATGERVIPDCCNTGIIFRALLFVNGTVLLASIIAASSPAAGVMQFLETSMLVQPTCLLSLVTLCFLRRPAALAPVSLQRLLCILVPSLVAGLLTAALSRFDWSAGGSVPFAVLEAILVAGVFGGVLQHYFELRVRAFSPALVEARLQALQARIRPHFLFNSLNAVLSLIRTEPMRAEETLQDLADMFRVFMRDTREMTTIEREIHFCKRYLAIEKVRLGPRLLVVWKTSELTGNAFKRGQIPALLLQPLVENAVHYGVEPSTEPAIVTVRFSRSIDRIEIVITNPYHPATPASGGNHMALNNIRERLALLYDVEGHLSTRIEQGVFEVRLRFPYVKADRRESIG
jgi:two-component system sensor histidine kinase AlgZ